MFPRPVIAYPGRLRDAGLSLFEANGNRYNFRWLPSLKPLTLPPPTMICSLVEPIPLEEAATLRANVVDRPGREEVDPASPLTSPPEQTRDGSQRDSSFPSSTIALFSSTEC